MAFTRPTLAEIIARVQSDLTSRLSLAGALLRRSVLYVLSRVIAGAAHMLHGHLEFLGRQLFADQAEGEYLARQASLYGITRLPPTFAQSNIEVTGTNGTVIPIGSRLVRADGAVYLTAMAATIAGGVASPAVNAEIAGAAGRLDVDVVLSFESPIAGANSSAVCVDQILPGTDAETDEALRARLLARISDPPMGGSVADFVAWSKEIAGVGRVWVEPLALGPGTVVVRVASSSPTTPILDPGVVAQVQAKLDTEAPVHCTPTAISPIADFVNLTLHVEPNTTAVKQAVALEFADLISRRAEPGGTILLSEIRTAIGTASGLTDYTLTSPSADLTFAVGHLPVYGVITWT